MADEIVVFVTCPASLAEIIAKQLVEERIAACVSILPQITSVYIWQEKICQEKEYLLFIKSNLSHFEILEKRIKELHTYEIPEIIAISVEAGSKAYLDWLNHCLN